MSRVNWICSHFICKERKIKQVSASHKLNYWCMHSLFEHLIKLILFTVYLRKPNSKQAIDVWWDRFYDWVKTVYSFRLNLTINIYLQLHLKENPIQIGFKKKGNVLAYVTELCGLKACCAQSSSSIAQFILHHCCSGYRVHFAAILH